MAELGGYCGYFFGASARESDGESFYSLERSPKFANNIETLVELAGLSDFVEVLVGPSYEGIKTLYSRGLETIDMMFLDHYKPAYTSDLKLCEHLGLITKGTVLAADKVIAPGNPPYLEYVRSSVEEKRLRLNQEAKADTESFLSRHAAQYGKVGELSTVAKGNPNIVYESKLVHSFEPTGVPVSFMNTVNDSLLIASGWCRDKPVFWNCPSGDQVARIGAISTKVGRFNSPIPCFAISNDWLLVLSYSGSIIELEKR
jgi:catechol O-methyltransferase